MAKTSGLGDGFLVGGYDLSGDVNSVDQISGGPAALDFTTIKDLAHERQGGLRDGTLQFTTFMDPAAAHVVLSALPTADTIGAYLRGTAIGNPSACINAKQINYDPTRGTDGTLTLKVQLQANGFGLEWGEQLTAGLRTDTAATTGTTQDDAASSSNGAQAYLQVTAFTGTDATVKVEHSADNSSWSDLVAFTAVTTAPGVQRATVTGTVNRYVRATTTTVVGITSVTFAVVLVRNLAAVTF